MATYYVSPSGSDANNGLGPDASHASNKPWLTVGKAMNTGSGVVPGDTVYIAPGTYYSEVLIPIAGIASAGSPTAFRCDPLNVQGFKTGAGVRLDAGIVHITSRTSGEGLDSEIASTANLIDANINNCSGVQVYNAVLEARGTSAAYIARLRLDGASDWLFQDCRMAASAGIYMGTGAATAARNLIVRRCYALFGNCLLDAASTSAAATANADLNILVEGCIIQGNLTTSGFALSASGGNLGGGVTFRGCTVIGRGTVITTVALKVSTVVPVTITGCLIMMQGTLAAGTAGQIIDGGNRWTASASAFTNVTPSGSSVFGVSPRLILPDLFKWGLERRRNDFWGWADDAHTNQRFGATGITVSDFRGGTARPWGAGSGYGAMQALNLVKDTTSIFASGGVNSGKITGKGEMEFEIQVPAAGFTLSVRTVSTGYGGASYPTLTVVANPSIGVAADVTATAADATEQTITTATITPTAQGVMKVRLAAPSTSVSSLTYFDLVQMTL